MAQPKEETVILVSKQGEHFEVPCKAAALSGIVRNALLEEQDENGEVDGDFCLRSAEERQMECERASSACLEKVVEFLTYCAGTPMKKITEPEQGFLEKTFAENVPQVWYQDYVEKLSADNNLDLFYSVRSAANFLEIHDLVLLTNLWLTFQMEGKTVEEIHTLLRIPPMTPEEMATAKEAHPWLFELPTIE